MGLKRGFFSKRAPTTPHYRGRGPVLQIIVVRQVVKLALMQILRTLVLLVKNPTTAKIRSELPAAFSIGKTIPR